MAVGKSEPLYEFDNGQFTDLLRGVQPARTSCAHNRNYPVDIGVFVETAQQVSDRSDLTRQPPIQAEATACLAVAVGSRMSRAHGAALSTGPLALLSQPPSEHSLMERDELGSLRRCSRAYAACT